MEPRCEIREQTRSEIGCQKYYCLNTVRLFYISCYRSYREQDSSWIYCSRRYLRWAGTQNIFHECLMKRSSTIFFVYNNISVVISSVILDGLIFIFIFLNALLTEKCDEITATNLDVYWLIITENNRLLKLTVTYIIIIYSVAHWWIESITCR